MNDIRQTIRVLIKNKGFAALAILTLGLGIGAATAMFSVISGVLLAPLPYKDANHLMVITEKDEKRNQVQPYSLSYPNYEDWRDVQQSFAELALFRAAGAWKIMEREHTLISARMVSWNFLHLLGVTPIIGRNFTAEDDRPDSSPTVILSYSGWLRLFGPQMSGPVSVNQSTSLLGEKLHFNGKIYNVIGILPHDFTFYVADTNQDADAFIPIGPAAVEWAGMRVRRPAISALGRLKPEVPRTAALAELDGIAHRLAVLYPDANKDRGAAVDPILDSIVSDDLRTALFFLTIAVVLVLLIACANVTNLLLARTTTRQKEIAIRFAVGGHWQVVRQLIIESVMLAIAGGAAGLLLAIIGIDLLVLAAPFGLPRVAGIGIDWRVLAFSLGISLLTGLTFGIAPILQALRSDVTTELKEGGTSSIAGHHTVQRIIIIGEVALAMVLLLGAGLIIRSTQKALSENPGFDPRQIWSFAVLISPPDYATASDRRKLIKDLETRFAEQRDVRAVGIGIGGVPKPIAVTPEYLRVMGIRLLKGRFFEERDTLTSKPVIVIDETLAKARFRDEEPIGQSFVINLPGMHELNLDQPREVIGVVNHIQRLGIETDDETVIQSLFYLAADQLPDELMENVAPRLMIKLGWPDEKVTDRLTALTHIFNPNLEISAPLKMQDAVDRALLPRRFVSRLFGVFALIAFVLAGMGIFGLVSYSVSQRRQEIGVRMALGADSTRVVTMIVRQAAILAATGIGLGLLASFWLKRFIEHLLFDVSATDPATYVTAATLLFGLAIAAAYIPAFRASRLEPMTALRGREGTVRRAVIGTTPSGSTVVYAVEVLNLHKIYSNYRGQQAPALSGVSFNVEPGTIFGLIGQNGAGKTTLVKILMGLASATSGTARLLGCAPGDSAARRQIGYLPEQMRIPEHLSPENFLRYMGRLNDVEPAILESRIPELLERVGLGGVNKPVKSFSKGMLQRLGLAQALLNDPELLFLDEPTDGLGPFGPHLCPRSPGSIACGRQNRLSEFASSFGNRVGLRSNRHSRQGHRRLHDRALGIYSWIPGITSCGLLRSIQ